MSISWYSAERGPADKHLCHGDGSARHWPSSGWCGNNQGTLFMWINCKRKCIQNAEKVIRSKSSELSEGAYLDWKGLEKTLSSQLDTIDYTIAKQQQ